MHFGAGNSRDMLCSSCQAARRDTLVTSSATDTTGVTCCTFSRNSSRDWCKSSAQTTKLVHASTTAAS